MTPNPLQHIPCLHSQGLAGSFEAGVAAAGRVLSRFEENTPQIFEQIENLCLG
jgi:hypothetical protein